MSCCVSIWETQSQGCDSWPRNLRLSLGQQQQQEVAIGPRSQAGSVVEHLSWANYAQLWVLFPSLMYSRRAQSGMDSSGQKRPSVPLHSILEQKESLVEGRENELEILN